MDNLNELGAVWQNRQSTKPSLKEINIKDTGIISKLKNLEKKHNRINSIKTISVIICMVFLFHTIQKLPEITLLIKIALAWIIGSLSIFIIMYWKKQYNSSKLNFIENSKEFISKTISKLNLQKQIITHLIPAMVLNLIIGMNLIYFELLIEESTTIRISLHIFITLFLILIMYLGLKVRKTRFNNDFKPMIDDLESIKQKLEHNE